VTTKTTDYRLRNWSQYNRSLVNRGSLTLWIEEGIQDKWLHEGKSGRRGASPTYSDFAITVCRSLGIVLRLPLRQSIGLVGSLFTLAKLDLPVPDYSTLSRRSRTLAVALAVRPPRPEAPPRHLVLDSTGLKVYGEGEWKVRQHGVGKRRTWRKLHLSVDADTGEILAALMSEGDAADGPLLPPLVEASQTVGGKVASARADGAYDSWENDAFLAGQGIVALIPPKKGSVIRQRKQAGVTPLPRDERLRAIRALGGGNFEYGRRRWARVSGYSRRSLVETAMMRQKVILGAGLRSRREDTQHGECLLRCRVLNVLTGLGMPDSYPVSYALLPGNSTG
jgi:hypothetical protein